MCSWPLVLIENWLSELINRFIWVITEAGGMRAGAVKSSVGLGMLLAEGIGDTIRISLAADPVEEIKVGFDILKSLRIRSRGINFIACPSCSRQEFDVIGTVNALEERLEDILTPMDVSIIGCVVNGPGEAEVSDLGLTGARNMSGFYLDGKRQKERLANDDLVEQLETRIRAKASKLEEARQIPVKTGWITAIPIRRVGRFKLFTDLRLNTKPL